MALDTTSFAACLKTMYPNYALENAIFQNNPFLAMVPKDENFKGDYKKIPLLIGAPQNTSANFSVAANSGGAIQTQSTSKAWLLSRVRKYALVEVSNEVLYASEGNDAAFAEAVKIEMDGGLRSISNQLGLDIFGTGAGFVGRLSSTSGVTTSITFEDPSQTTTLEIGAFLQFSTAATGGSIKTGTLQITSINRATGTVGLSASGATLSPALATSDYVYIAGNQAANMSGLQAWLPDVAPSSGDNFFSVDRSVDNRLYGNYIDRSTSPIEEALLDGDELVYTAGGKVSHYILHPKDYLALNKSLGSKVIYCDEKVGDVGFQGFVIQGMNGPIKVFADRSAPKSVAWALQMDTWKLCSIGKLAQIYTGDGLSMLRSTTADSVRAQIASYFNLACTMPAWNARIKLAA